MDFYNPYFSTKYTEVHFNVCLIIVLNTHRCYIGKNYTLHCNSPTTKMHGSKLIVEHDSLGRKLICTILYTKLM